jgi:RNA polymerase sigma-70 factor (ECF subfamily)
VRREEREKTMNIEELYRTYFDIVYRYIRSISQDGSLAEEVTQETFFKALEKIDQFRGDCDVRVWLCQIAKNTLYDHLKKQKKQLLGDEKLEKTENAGGELLEEKLAQRSQAMEIHKVLHRLSEPYKEVFSLRTFGELTFREIGMLFGKSENWARVTYYRARVKIREELEYEDHM